MPKRPYDWRVDTHGCYKCDNTTLGFGPRDQTAHLLVFLHLRTTNLPGPTASCAVNMRNKEGWNADITNTSVCGDDVLDCDVARQSHVSAHLFPSSPTTCESPFVFCPLSFVLCPLSFVLCPFVLLFLFLVLVLVLFLVLLLFSFLFFSCSFTFFSVLFRYVPFFSFLFSWFFSVLSVNFFLSIFPFSLSCFVFFLLFFLLFLCFSFFVDFTCLNCFCQTHFASAVGHE